MVDYQLIAELFEALNIVAKSSELELENLIWIIKHLASNDPIGAIDEILESFKLNTSEFKELEKLIQNFAPKMAKKENKPKEGDKLWELIDHLDDKKETKTNDKKADDNVQITLTTAEFEKMRAIFQNQDKDKK